MNNNMTVGIDLAKNTFYMVALNDKGEQMWRKKVRRAGLLKFIANLPHCHIVMEACSGAHYWARCFTELGHRVSMLPAQHIKAYLRGQKNDYNDAEAIAEAALHNRIRAIPNKTLEQQDTQSIHVIRKSLNGDKVRIINQLRGLLSEYGLVLPKGKAIFVSELPFILEDGENQLTSKIRMVVHRQYLRLVDILDEISWYEKQIEIAVKENNICQQLLTIPGFGPLVSSQFENWIGDGKQFKRGRDASAALGVVPRQHSTGGKSTLLGITKRGNCALRTNIIQGARAVVIHAHKKQDPLSLWIVDVVNRRGSNKAVVALANKLIRIAWAVVTKNQTYQAAGTV